MSEETVGNITFNNSLVSNMATFTSMMEAMGFKYVGIKREDEDKLMSLFPIDEIDTSAFDDSEKDVKRGT
jgi:hypothetical protein